MSAPSGVSPPDTTSDSPLVPGKKQLDDAVVVHGINSSKGPFTLKDAVLGGMSQEETKKSGKIPDFLRFRSAPSFLAVRFSALLKHPT